MALTEAQRAALTKLEAGGATPYQRGELRAWRASADTDERQRIDSILAPAPAGDEDETSDVGGFERGRQRARQTGTTRSYPFQTGPKGAA